MKKRLLAIVLSAAMAATMMPVTAGAASGKAESVETLDKLGVTESAGKDAKEDAAYEEGEAVAIISSNSLAVQKLRTSAIDEMSGVSVETIGDFSENANSAKLRGSGEATQAVLVSSETMTTEQLVKKLEKMDGVEAVSPNYKMHAYGNNYNDTYKDIQWGIENKKTFLNGDESVQTNVPSLWEKTSVSKDDPVVAVIDSGVNYEHEDLKGSMWTVPASLRSRLSGTYGYDFYDDDPDPMDGDGHGTHCAGIIAAGQNNGVGVSGVSGNAKIMALRFLDEDGWGILSDAVRAYDYVNRALDLGVNIVAVNCSWGGEGGSKLFASLTEKVGKKGALTIAAAGNSAADADKVGQTFPSGDYVLNVASMNNQGGLSGFSDYGAKTVDLAAPGSDIVSAVAEDTFAPAIYSESKRGELCDYFYDGGTVSGQDSSGFGTRFVLAAEESGAAAQMKVSADTENAYSGSGRAVRWDIKGASAGSVYYLLIPFEGKASDKAIYASMMVKSLQTDYDSGSEMGLGYAQESPEEVFENQEYTTAVISSEEQPLDTKNAVQEDCWTNQTNMIFARSRNLSSCVALIFLTGDYTGTRDYSFAIDEIGVSRANVDSGKFGKYDVYSGTSMAAPFVSGCAALLYDKEETLSGAAPSGRAALLKKAVLANVHKSKKLTGKVASDGYIDVNTDTAAKQTPALITGASMLSSGKAALSGQNFGAEQGTVSVKFAGSDTSYEAAVTSWGDMDIEIEASVKDASGADIPMSSRSVEFTVHPAGGAGLTDGSRTFFLSAYKPACRDSGTYTAEDTVSYIGGAPANNGKKMYFVGSEGTIAYVNSMTPSAGRCIWDTAGYMNLNTFFSESGSSDETTEITLTLSDPACADGKLWFLATMELGYSRETKLFSYTISTEKYTAYELDVDGVDGLSNLVDNSPSIGAYNGEIWFVGGLGTDGDKVVTSNKTYVFNPSKKTWRSGPDLPAGRYGAKVLQTGTGLTVSLGYEKLEADGKVPDTFVWNGKSFESIAMGSLGMYSNAQSEEEKTFRNVKYSVPAYPGAVGICKGGLVFAGLPLESGEGDSFTLDTTSGKKASAGYSVGGISSESRFEGASLGGRFYIVSYIENGDNEAIDDEFLALLGETVRVSYDYKVMDFGISSGLFTVTGKAGKGGKISGTGSYVPGSSVTVKAVPSKYYVTKSFKVGGKTVKGAKTFRITANTTASATFTAPVTKVKLNKTKAALAAGKSLKLKATVSPSVATNKKVKWTSSNTKYATVNSAGKVTAKKAGIGKTVKITAAATDGSGKKAVCTIRIKKK